MVVTLATGVMTLGLSDGTNQVINLDNVVDVEATVNPQYTYGTTASTSGTGSLNVMPQSLPLSGGISTALQSEYVNQYRIRLHFNDNRWLDLYCGTLTNDGATWVNTLAGANIGVAAIRTVM